MKTMQPRALAVYRKKYLAAILSVLAAIACDETVAPTAPRAGEVEPTQAAAAAPPSISRAELSGSRLRVEGRAAANAPISVDGTTMATSDGAGNFRIERTGFSSPSCRITVSDGVGSATATLTGCTPSSPPPPPPSSGPPAPSLVAPAAGASLAQPITLSWSAVTDPAGPIIGYNWEVATSSTFASVLAWGTPWYPAEGVPPPNQDRLSGMPNGTYFWRVNAIRKNPSPAEPSHGAWSAVSSFTVSGLGPAPGTPVVSGPASGARFHPYETFQITWSAVPEADHYWFEYDDEPSFAYPQAAGLTGIGKVPGTAIPFTFGFPAGTLHYRVRAVNAQGVRGLPSATRTFVVAYDAPIPPAPTPVAPANGAQLSLPATFDWSDVPNSQDYELQIDDSPAFTGGCGTVETCITNLKPSQWTEFSLQPGTKYWRVRSGHGESAPGVGAFTAWSTTRSFTVAAGALAIARFLTSDTIVYSGGYFRAHVELNQPAGPGDVSVSLTSSHPSVPVPATVTIPAGMTFVDPLISTAPAPVVGEDTPVTLTATVGASTQTVNLLVKPPSIRGLDIGAPGVAAVFSGGTSTTASPIYNGLPPDGSVIALSSSTPVVEVPPSVTYQRIGGSTFPVVLGQVSVITTATITATWKGVSVQASLTLHPPPVLSAPTPGATFAAGQVVRFDWNDVLGAYDIQIDDASTFANPLLVNQPTWVSEYSSSALPGGALFWRVRTKDTYGQPGPWSEVRSLTVTAPAGPLPAPVLQFPANGARITAGQTVAFMWSTVAGANSYTLLVDDASSFGSPFVLSQTVVGSNQHSTSTLPRKKLWWRVRANDAAGNPGAWSATRQLEVR